MPISPFTLPEGFRFGVATAGFQIEGGYNGPGEPANNWVEWEHAGQVEPSGIALDFWHDYERQLRRAVASGCNAFRMSVEWARCEPSPGELDTDALAHYGAILDCCLALGLQPLVTLHHFTHPAWLGCDFWLESEAPERFANWAGVAVDALGDRCRKWITVNEINVYGLQTYFNGMFPPGRRFDNASLVRSVDHLLAGHVLAYDEIHRRQPDATVATNTYSFSTYETDRLLVDVLLARVNGVDRASLGAWLAERRRQFRQQIAGDGFVEFALRKLAETLIPLDAALPRAVGAVYASPHDCTLDVTQIDFYDPRVGRKFRPPGHRTAGGRNWMPLRMLWDDPPDPKMFARFCALNAEPGRPLWVAENGLCNRVRRGVAFPRVDGWDRVRYLRSYLGALSDVIRDGIPIGAYYHWCLADNYEWGSYEPRFGLYAVDRERGLRWSELDSMGAPAAATYAEIIAGMRRGDLSVVDRDPQ